jgi:NAD(P)H-nitrite reductase large subunit
MKHIVILGNGISGITTARHIRKYSKNNITVISSETEHFFSRTALMYIFMGHMKYKNTMPYEKGFWKKNRIDLVFGHVNQVDTKNKKLILSKGENIAYDELILATGSKSNKFGWPGQDSKAVHGLYSIQDVEAMEKYAPTTKRAVIIGGGLIGIEMAEMWHSRGVEVTMLVREDSFWNMVLPPEESQMINREIEKHHIDLRLGEDLKEIISDNNGRVKSVITNNGEEILCQFVGLTVGVHPNIEFLKDSEIETDRGILIDQYFKTNIPDVYAIGDCAQMRQAFENRKPVEQVWYTGRMMGETLAYNLCHELPLEYQPGTWFNSAKFFDIEYQTYGWVWAKPKENEESLFWEHKSGQKGIRIVFDKASKKLLGLNTMGIRLRHEIANEWITSNKELSYVMDHLEELNFDPEFYLHHENAIRNKFIEIA